MLADGWRSVWVLGVEYADCVGFGREGGDVGLAGPAEGCCFVVGGEVAACDLASEDEGDDVAGDVLVDAGDGYGLDIEAGLFPYFASQAFLDGLALFEYAARWFPVVVVAALD